ncbi:MAG: 50S ribosomal protein L22 [Candidatus Nealsonbacteria bacterium]|nr:50S ribosomal protein L22 [Candidatus Nealsonbacteria bacterium]
MTITVKLRRLRVAPRKARLVADLIRGKTIEEAQAVLNFTIKRAALPMLKLLKSAAANAKHNFQMSDNNLYISKITVDGGPKFKRWMPRARGQAYQVQKKTSHVTIELKEIKKDGSLPAAASSNAVLEETKIKEASKETKQGSANPKQRLGPELKRPKAVLGKQKFFRRKSV